MLVDPKILIVDDEEANVVLLEFILQHSGYRRIQTATDPRKVADLTKQFAPDLVLLDLSMPFLDGFAVMAQLRAAQAPDSFLPILILTADVTLQTKRRALANGANDFVTKPFENEEVLLRCKNLLQIRALHLELQDQNQRLEEKVRQRTQDLETTMVELKASQRQNVQQERLRALGEMSGGVAHDFNNQLTVILGYSELLLLNGAQMLSNKLMVTQYLQTINASARESVSVVGRLRDFSRQRAVDDIFLPVDLPKLVKEVAVLTQPKWKSQAQAQGSNIAVRLELEPAPTVAGNAAELRESIANMLFNAVDAMPQGGIITLRTRLIQDMVVFEIGDTGVGMSEDVRNRCLDPFFTTKGDGHSGLGLSTTYGVIQRHGGHMDIVSEPTKGTTVLIRLPVRAAVGIEGKNSGGAVDAGMVRPLRVLLVEDDPKVREVVSEYLRRDQHEVVTAVNGLEGLEKFVAGAFDLVVTDLALDAMNGERLAEAIKQRGPTPVILLTGFADGMLASGAKPACVDVLLRKPLSPGELWRAMAQAMSATTTAAPGQPKV